MKSKHVVTYMGAGTWRDSTGKIFSDRDSETYVSGGTEEEFLKSRGDIAFMIGYGQMTISTVSIDDAPANVPPVNVTPVVQQAGAEVIKPVIK